MTILCAVAKRSVFSPKSSECLIHRFALYFYQEKNPLQSKGRGFVGFIDMSNANNEKRGNGKFPRWLRVQAYKHNGALHRQWTPAYLVEENSSYWALASKSSAVTESDGRRWITKEKAIFILFKEKWMNVIAMFKEPSDSRGGEGKQYPAGICYYVNIASPTIFDKGFLKYIDYDLDVKLYPDGLEKTLDENEYLRHASSYGYSEDLLKAIEKSLTEVKRMINQKEFPFSDEAIESLYERFLSENHPMPPRQ